MHLDLFTATKGFEGLPWRSRRKGSDINDIHVSSLSFDNLYIDIIFLKKKERNILTYL